MPSVETEASPARQYAAIRYRLLLPELLGSMAWLAFLQGSGISQSVARWWARAVGPSWLMILGYLAVIGTLSYLVFLPLHVYRSLLLERRFGLSRLSLRGWLAREAKRVALSGLLALGLIEGLYALLRHAPGSWPVWATLGWVTVSVMMVRVFPTVVLPLFYRVTPLEDRGLAERLLALCRRVGLSALEVFRFQLGAETRKANAALAGLGRTRRILLSDTLLESFTPDEIEGVLAHELAHQHYHHLTVMLGLSAVGSWIAFAWTDQIGWWWTERLGLDGLADIAGWPMLALWFSLLGLIGLPIQNGLSRWCEWQADRFALRTTAPQAFAAALRRLGELNLADPTPPRWIEWLFYDHPSMTRRIDAAQRLAAS